MIYGFTLLLTVLYTDKFDTSTASFLTVPALLQRSSNKQTDITLFLQNTGMKSVLT